jgi:diguanylate cyclase (GGDEF)-like protein
MHAESSRSGAEARRVWGVPGPVGETRAISGIEPNPQFAARIAGLLFACGSVVAWVVPLASGQRPAGDPRGYAPALGTMLLAAVFYLLPGRLAHPRLAQAAPAVGTALISYMAYADAGNPGVVAVFYVWVALYCSYFLTREEAALQIGWIAAAYAIALRATSSYVEWAGAWIAVVAAVVVSAALLRVVREAVVGLIERLADAARTDHLTGLENRRGLDERMATELERARRHDRPLSVVVGDVDHFKRVNDTLGHAAGDAALEHLGGILAQGKRRIDSVARTGGEEFTILLPDSDQHQAYLVAERLRGLVQRRFAGARMPLTFSFGIATFPTHGHTAEGLLEAADQALYAAKALGRNRSVTFSPEVASVFAPRLSPAIEGEMQLATLLSLAEALDRRDTGTAKHSRTVGRYCAVVAEELGLSPERVKRIEIAGVLHDIGKIGIPDAILRKNGPLAKNEYLKIHTHPEIGAQILGAKGLEDIRSWVLAHHERPDGKGYPKGLTDEQIPLEAKILAVADAYEAMTADRPYRSALGDPVARTELLRWAGSQFDPRIVSALLAGLTRAARDSVSPA